MTVQCTLNYERKVILNPIIPVATVFQGCDVIPATIKPEPAGITNFKAVSS
jgi:hypothetical protein